jgi:hypothetical protein
MQVSKWLECLRKEEITWPDRKAERDSGVRLTFTTFSVEN